MPVADEGVGVVEPPVVVALELDDAATAGGRARHAESGLHHLGAGRAEADPVGPAEALTDQLGSLDLSRMGGAEDDAVSRCFRDGAAYAFLAVTEERWTLAEEAVDVLASVGVPDAAPFATHDHGRRAEKPSIRAHAARQHVCRALPETCAVGRR